MPTATEKYLTGEAKVKEALNNLLTSEISCQNLFASRREGSDEPVTTSALMTNSISPTPIQKFKS